MTEREDYYWKDQSCPMCELPPTKIIGKRGGIAHREALGVEAQIWRCGKCDLLFPNPMPIPKGGLAQHYETDPNEYFVAHDEEGKSANAENMVARAEELLGCRGRLLDVGVGRGELIAAALKRGWEADGIEPS